MGTQGRITFRNVAESYRVAAEEKVQWKHGYTEYSTLNIVWPVDKCTVYST